MRFPFFIFLLSFFLPFLFAPLPFPFGYGQLVLCVYGSVSVLFCSFVCWFFRVPILEKSYSICLSLSTYYT